MIHHVQLGPASLARMGRTMSAGAQQQLLQQQRSLGSAPRPSASHLGQVAAHSSPHVLVSVQVTSDR